MILTDEEIERGAEAAAKSTFAKPLAELSETQRATIRSIVANMAHVLMAGTKRSPEALQTFMNWMGEEPT